jgi:fatty acid desaturase
MVVSGSWSVPVTAGDRPSVARPLGVQQGCGRCSPPATSATVRRSTPPFGALNYQIEHHLFPGMPRPNLRRAQPIIVRFGRQRGLAYVQTSLLNSYAQTLRHTNDVGRNPQPNSP